jgi:hypothetical protein
MTRTWRLRRDTRKEDAAHGITFLMWERQGKMIRGEATYKADKIHLDGIGSLTLALDQNKYGDELIAQIYSPDAAPTVVKRVNSNAQRTQVFLGPLDLETADMLRQVANEIELRVLEKDPNAVLSKKGGENYGS